MKWLRFIKDHFRKIRPDFLAAVFLLQIIGLFALYSATAGAYSSNSRLFYRQGLWLLAGWVVFFIIYGLHYRWLYKTRWILYGSHLIFLVLTLVFGKGDDAVNRWLDLGFVNYQPSETLKFVLVLIAAGLLSHRKFKQSLSLREFVGYGLIILLPVSLVVIQPDLGTAGLTLLITGSLILFNGIRRKVFIVASLCFLSSLPLAWHFMLEPYQKNRVISFVQPQKDSQGTGYNVIQSKIAIGSGRFYGKGFTKGTQHQLQFLPERHTDFIFSVISEEYGFFGSLITLGLFWILIFLILNSASTSKDRLGCYLCLGTGAFLFWHTFLNIAMTMGLFPVVGAPLPLISYGGSHILTTMAFLGLVASVNKRKEFFKKN